MFCAGGEQVYGASRERCGAHACRAVNKQKSQKPVAAPKQHHSAVRRAFEKTFIDVEQRVGEKLHPQLLARMNNLKLQLLGITQFVERLLVSQ